MKRLMIFLRAAAFEQRARDRERRMLAVELRDILRGRDRETMILARIAQLQKADSEFDLSESRRLAVAP